MTDLDRVVREVLSLPRTTGECDEGPVVEYRPGRVCVRYDIEGEHGPVWTTVRFGGAIGLKFTPDVAVTNFMVRAYSKVFELESSEWLAALRQGADAMESIPGSLRHFFIYFDHYGCLEVIAQGVEVSDGEGR